MTSSTTDQNRRTDDPRIADIQDSVHQIRNDVHGLERRFERADIRISDVERKVIENSAAQRALEQVMNSENRRLTDKIDQVHSGLRDLGTQVTQQTSESTRDIKAVLRTVVAMLVTVLGTLGWFVFVKSDGHF